MTRDGSAAGDFILLGKITKPHGIRGEVKIYPYSGQPENFPDYRKMYIGPSEEERVPYTIERARVQGKTVILKLDGCGDRSAAEHLVDHELWLERDDLPDLGDEEYYWADLEDKAVRTEDGLELGWVTGILDTGAHDILSVTGRGHEYLIPIREEFVVTIDDHEVVLRLPPGLLEINKS